MKFLRNMNRFFYTPRFSIFDGLCIVMIGYLASDYSPWWYLLLLPTTAFSVRMERLLEKE